MQFIHSFVLWLVQNMEYVGTLTSLYCSFHIWMHLSLQCHINRNVCLIFFLIRLQNSNSKLPQLTLLYNTTLISENMSTFIYWLAWSWGVAGKNSGGSECRCVQATAGYQAEVEQTQHWQGGRDNKVLLIRQETAHEWCLCSSLHYWVTHT